MPESKVSVRLDVQTRSAIMAYQNAHDMNFSQATRMLLALALREEENADVAFRTAAFREGIRAGVEVISKRLQVAVSGALGDLESYVRGETR